MLNQPDYDNDETAGHSRLSDEGLCLLDGDIIVNPLEVAMIRKLDGKTLLYRSGVNDPDILPAAAFEQIRDILFLSGDDDDLEDLFDDEEADDDSEDD